MSTRLKKCGSRQRAWEFFAWAYALDRTPTVIEISAFLNISLDSARYWRTDWFRFKTKQLAATGSDSITTTEAKK